jgi:hypothetical protein
MTAFDQWARGYGVIAHAPQTCARVEALAQRLLAMGKVRSADEVYAILAAADRLTSATMWAVVHMTYASRVDLTGAQLPADAFKQTPEGHTGGSLNVAPAYVAYLAANALSGETRGWLLGQGHCVAAIEAANALAGNLSDTQAGRYGWDEAGLSRLASDFYSYAIDPQGRPARPLGSHVNAHTAGGLSEGGYLGFAEIEYVHMPLPGEKLVAMLSDGAFEEQRGSDWSERWWRAEDCGLVAPIMILNGRRIEQTEARPGSHATWKPTASNHSRSTAAIRPPSFGRSSNVRNDYRPRPDRLRRGRAAIRCGCPTPSPAPSRASAFQARGPTGPTTCRWKARRVPTRPPEPNSTPPLHGSSSRRPSSSWRA